MVDQFFSLFWQLLFLAFVLSTVFLVILDNRSPFKTMAWILLLYFLPVVGLFLYFFIGRSNRKERLISRSGYTHLVRHPTEAYQQQLSLASGTDTPLLRQFFHKTNDALCFGGNRVEVYTDGCSMVEALLEDIRCATHHIHLEFYIFENDDTGRRIRDALVERARAGVKVRLLYDDVGCWKVDHQFFDQMLCEGIEVQAFLKVRFPSFTSKVNYRNHRKIVVIDGRVGYIGGMNIANRYLKGFDWGVWRDTHVRIEGKAVYGLQTSFLTDWYAMDRTLYTSSEYFPTMGDVGTVAAQVVTSDAVGRWKDIMQGLVMAIANARKYFYIQTPYFLPTDEVMTALQTAALAGVDVRVMLPKRADAFITHQGSFSYLDELMEAGVKVYLYRPGFLHSKLWVWDDEASSVGSTNMDFRSFEHNFEANVFFYDVEMALYFKEVFLQDQCHCLALSPKLWAHRSWKHKVTESVIRLLAPLL